MNIEQAHQMMKIIMKFDALVGEIDSIVTDMEGGDEKKEWKRRLGQMMGSQYVDFIIPILRQFPELEHDYPIYCKT